MELLASSITVAAALELPELRRGLPEVVAGGDSLTRLIRWVHAGEVPNIATLLRGGELLLTTGMGIGDSGAGQRRFVAELAGRDIAGLVIELGERFPSRLPRALVAAAQAHGLPLIELHAEVPFVAVTEAIHTELVNGHYARLRRADDLQDRFTAEMLQGGGVPGVLSLLAAAVENPVFLESADGQLLAHAVPPGGVADEDPVAAWRHARDQAEGLGLVTTVMGDGPQGAGRLVSLPLRTPLEPLAPLALQRAAGIIALALMRGRQEDELRALGRGELLSRLAAGRIEPAAASARARDAGFDPRRRSRFLPLAARLPAAATSGGWTPLLRDLERELAGLGEPSLLGIDRSAIELLLVIGASPSADRRGLAQRAAEAIGRVAARRGGAEPVIAVGALGSWELLADGLHDSLEAVDAAMQLPRQVWFDAGSLALDRLLWGLRGHDALRRYVARMLGPLIDHDTQRRHLLLPTLELLCATGGRRAEAARRLHLNRQALYDRIERIERLLGADLSEPQTLFAVHLALRARHHLSPPR